MTKTARGSSLAQTREPTVQHHHNHNHNNHHDSRHLLHAHLHARHKHGGGGSGEDTHARSHENKLLPRLPDLEPHVTRVVQTISVIQYIDETGSVIDVKTIIPEQTAPRSTSAADLTLDTSFLLPLLPTLSVPSLPSGDGYPAATASGGSGTESSAATAPPSSLSYSGSLTSAPLPYSSQSGTFNSTSLRHSFSNSTILSHFFNNATSSHRTTHSSSTRSSTWLTSTTEPAVTAFAGDGGAGASDAGATAASPSSGETGTPAPDDVPTASVIGGVFGGLAGIALIAAVLLFLIKWKRRQANGLQLLGDGGNSARRLSFLGPGGPGGGGAGSMTERSIPFAIPSALAALGAPKRGSQTQLTGGESNERGFYRVSGRKLTSVLHSGGDGYSEPSSDRAVSGTSFYRDSMAMFNEPGGQTLQLGSPMRPESGVVVVRSGPARTPVREQNPFADPDDSPERLSPPNLEPFGRSLVSLAGSRGSGGSGSRFREEV